MVTRTYDVKLTVDNAAPFATGNVVIGNTSLTSASIIAIEGNEIKVSLANVLQEFSASEVIHSNSTILSGNAYGELDGLVPFSANIASGNTTTAIATISAIEYNRFTTAKNTDTQNPIVRLLQIYYPGEWYPPNQAGNPTGAGEGRAWPNGFPIQIAQVVGATNEDLSYNVVYDGGTYTPAPVNISGIDQASDGKVNELTLEIYNVADIITSLVENPYISGNNISNSVVALVNGEYLHGIDPRTVNATPSDVGSPGDIAYDTLTRARANGLAYDASVVANTYGFANASFTKTETESVNGTWRNDTFDSRDLLGAVVNIKTTFAHFLDYWPEYSIISSISSNVITVKNSAPYRVGDNVISTVGSTQGTILQIDANNDIHLSNALDGSTTVDAPLYIVNAEADAEAHLDDTFKIDQLEGLSDHVANFGLVSWLSYFKQRLPKRRFYKNTCQWVYKGEECQYPSDGSSAIPGTVPTEYANGYFTAGNATTADPNLDVCSKSFAACSLRNNTIHYGAYPATGRRLPKA